MNDIVALLRGESARAQWGRIRQWSWTLAEFGAAQAMIQLCTAMAGLLIVRNMAKEEYALFAIVNVMQASGNLLADLGIGVGVYSIGGRVWSDPNRFGQLLNTALGLRRRFSLVSLTLVVPVAAWMLWRNGASLPVVVMLCLCVVAGVIPLLGSSIFNISFQLHAQYRRIQSLDFGVAALRVLLLAGLMLTKMNAVLAASVAVLGNWAQFLVSRRWVADNAEMAATVNLDDRREILSLSLKSLPNAVFFCFQGQVTLLILTLVGNSTGIAEFTALGRLAAFFGVFSVVFSRVLVPQFARCQDPARMARLYLFLAGAAVLALAPITTAAWLLPGPFLWILGGNYAGLERACGLVVAASCIGALGGILWGLNSSKAWIRVQAPCFIPVILTAQLVAAQCLNLRTFHGVLMFNLVTAAAPLPIYALDAWLGLRARNLGCNNK